MAQGKPAASFILTGASAPNYYVNRAASGDTYVAACASDLKTHVAGMVYDPAQSLGSLLTIYAGPDTGQLHDRVAVERQAQSTDTDFDIFERWDTDGLQDADGGDDACERRQP